MTGNKYNNQPSVLRPPPSPTDIVHRIDTTSINPVRSNPREPEQPLTLQPDHDHAACVDIERIVVLSVQPIPPPHRSYLQVEQHGEHVAKPGGGCADGE